MVQVGKLLRNGQSQTGGVVLGRGGGVEIPVKYSGLILRRNAAARVPDAHQRAPASTRLLTVMLPPAGV